MQSMKEELEGINIRGKGRKSKKKVTMKTNQRSSSLPFSSSNLVYNGLFPRFLPLICAVVVALAIFPTPTASKNTLMFDGLHKCAIWHLPSYTFKEWQIKKSGMPFKVGEFPLASFGKNGRCDRIKSVDFANEKPLPGDPDLNEFFRLDVSEYDWPGKRER